MRRLITLGFILIVPILSYAQIEMKVFYNTDKQDDYSTLNIRSLVFGDDKLTVNTLSGEETYLFTEFDSLMLDEFPPELSLVTTGTVESGDDVSAVSSKDGTVYLVAEGTTVSVPDFETAVTTGDAAKMSATENIAVLISTTGLDDGKYVVYAVDDGDRISSPSATITIVTYYPPVLSDVTTGTIAPGDDVSATSDKDGTIYLVPENTAVTVTAFDAAVTGSTAVSAAATAGTPVSLSTTNLAEDNYLVYAIDADDRISDPSSTIIIMSTGLIHNTLKDVLLYPNPVKDKLYIKCDSDLTEIVVINMLGKELMKISQTTKINEINTSILDEGIYFIKLTSESQSATYKFIKK